LSVLDRLVAMLLVLAGVAEAVASAPLPRRCFVLWVLRQADARVKGFAGNYAFWMGLPPRPVLLVCPGNGAVAALSLALSLRVLALAIRDMIVQLRRRHFLRGGRPPVLNGLDGLPRLCRAGIRPVSTPSAASPDTS
jgi:hypothetical protein